MILARTPFRISFFGGGSDYPNYYKTHGGCVLSTTINKYCYIMLRYFPSFFDYKYQIRYRKQEHCNTIDKIQHPTVRECLKFINIEDGVEIVHTADLPARSGMGSSSSFTVSLLHSLHALKCQLISKKQLALEAIHVEQDLVKENVGSQDQTAAAFGGFNRIDFGGHHNISVSPIILPKKTIEDLQDNLMLFFTGFSRTASHVAGKYVKTIEEKKHELSLMKDMVGVSIDLLNNNNLDGFGRLLNESWRVKKSISNVISNTEIDAIYDKAMKSGALGGKLCGAGNGGMLLLYVQKDRQSKVKKALKSLLHIPFRFDFMGSQIIMYSPQEI